MQHILGRVFQRMSKIKKVLHEEYQSFFCSVMLTVKNTPDNAGDIRDFAWPLGWEDLWRRRWQPTPIILPGEPRGQRSLQGYSSWGCTLSDTTVVT